MKKLAGIVILLWITVTVTLAYTGVKLIPQLIILGLVTVTGLLQAIFWHKSFRRWLVIPLVALMMLAASLVSFVQMGLWLFPAVTSDGHPVMPIGQTFGGVAFAFLFCVGLTWLYFARLKMDSRLEAVWVWVLNLALAVTFVVDLLL